MCAQPGAIHEALSLLQTEIIDLNLVSDGWSCVVHVHRGVLERSPYLAGLLQPPNATPCLKLPSNCPAEGASLILMRLYDDSIWLADRWKRHGTDAMIGALHCAYLLQREDVAAEVFAVVKSHLHKTGQPGCFQTDIKEGYMKAFQSQQQQRSAAETADGHRWLPHSSNDMKTDVKDLELLKKIQTLSLETAEQQCAPRRSGGGLAALAPRGREPRLQTKDRARAASPHSNPEAPSVPLSPAVQPYRFAEIQVKTHSSAAAGVQPRSVRPNRLSPGPSSRSPKPAVSRQRSATSPVRQCHSQHVVPSGGQAPPKTLNAFAPGGFKWPPQMNAAGAVRSLSAQTTSSQKVFAGYPTMPHLALTPTPLRSPSPACSYVPDEVGYCIPQTPTLEDRAKDSVYVHASHMLSKDSTSSAPSAPQLASTQPIEYSFSTTEYLNSLTNPQGGNDAVYLSVANLRNRGMGQGDEAVEQQPLRSYGGRFIDVAGE